MNSDHGLIGGIEHRGSNLTTIVLKILLLFGLLYIFILAITLLGASFKAFGGDFGKNLMQVTSNPIMGLVIGILATAVIQSSSTTTSLIVGLVGAGAVGSGIAGEESTTMFLSFENAIPMVMGANIGTSITNTLVSLAHISRGDEFKRAFAGATVHDFFNLCAVIVLLPLQIQFGIISKSALYLQSMFVGFGGMKFSSPLKAITKPVANLFLHGLNDSAWLGALIAFVLLFLALRYIVKLMKSMVLARVEKFFQRFIFRTAALSMLLGIVLTVLVQSSSITTSLVIPLIGAGVISLEQVFPYMLGANIGTTVTAFLASFVTNSSEAVAVAFAHLIFNIYGIIILWPLKKVPITLSMKLSEATQKSKLFPLGYIVVVFFLIPGAILYFMR